MTKLVVFDAYAIIYRAYFALPASLTDLKNEPINAVYGLTSMLFRVIEDTNPTHIAFAYDTAAKTFRDEMFEEYRSQREAPDKELISQFPKSELVVNALNIPIYRKDGYEADDVIGTIAHKVDDQVETLVVTGDRDMLQLVDKTTHLYMPGKSLSAAIEYDIHKSTEKMGVPPKQVIDFKALVGDPSDNYKGVPGIGPKTAQNLLEEYKTLDNIYKNIDKLSNSVKSKLIENKENAYLSQRLATIITDVEIDFNLEDCKKWQLWNKNVEKTFDELGFKTLKKRAEKLQKNLQQEKQGNLF